LIVSDTENAVEPRRVAFLGPAGTFTEEALRTQTDLGNITTVPMRTMPDVLAAVNAEDADLGFVAIENSIEGTVNVALDSLIFDTDLLIQAEVVMNIQMSLLAPKGVKLKDIKRVVSFPVASAQCREFLTAKLPTVEVVASNSTSDAARQVSRSTSRNTAALGTKLAAELYGLQVLEPDVSDNDENQTRFVLVGRSGIPARTGHDKTSIVVFQSADKPGSLHSILGQFSARNINLSKLESRPTKRGLGDYCFVIDLEGHVEDEVIADCLRDLHVQSKNLKFLGSYPSAGEQGPKRRRDAVASWRAADAWIAELRSQVTPEERKNRRFKVVK
jgi:prephenate dehydratase